MIEKTIIERFLEAQNRLVFQSSDLSLDSIASMVAECAIDITPKYQRRERWDKTRQSALIESFLLNIPVPPIFLAEDEYGKYSVIDGKQRITAIFNFIKKDMKLVNLEKFKELENFTFQDLPSQLNNALKIRPYLRVITLLKQSDPVLKYEVFNRLNTGGITLLPQEIRNAAYGGNLNDLIIDLTENKFLQRQFNINDENERLKSKVYKEMVDVEYILRFFTLRDCWDNFPGNMKNALDKYMKDHYLEKDEYINKLKFIFNKTIELCENIWQTDAFKRPDGRNEMIQGVYDAQMVGISFFLDQHTLLINYKSEIKKAFKDAYFKDNEFQTSMRQFTSNIKQVQYRIGNMKRIIKNVIENGNS